jgi:hypothetical protein
MRVATAGGNERQKTKIPTREETRDKARDMEGNKERDSAQVVGGFYFFLTSHFLLLIW